MFENGGHGNVGAKDERAFYYQYLADMTEAVRYAMERIEFRDGMKAVPNLNNHTAYHVSWTDPCARSAVETLRPKYGQYYGYEFGAWSNAEQIVWALFAYPR